MTAPEDPLLVRVVLRLYPARWRERYGEEFAALLSDTTAGASRLTRIWAIVDAMLGGIDTRLRFLRGNAMPGRVRMTLKAAIYSSLRCAATVTGIGKLRQIVYGLYARRLRREMAGKPLPRHVGMIMDGNRRWALGRGMASASLGHKYGAEHAEEVLSWCETAGIRHVTLAVGYGDRQEVIEAFRSLLHDRAEHGATLADVAMTITPDDIAQYLYTAGQPDPDLVIRTSGEQRLSNFLLWQSAYSELYFCEAYWPAFREIDFLRALRSFAARQRRYGG